jgi:hypothetical protein
METNIPPPPSPHQQLEALFEQLTDHLAVLDRDTNLALSEYDRSIHCERRALVQPVRIMKAQSGS